MSKRIGLEEKIFNIIEKGYTLKFKYKPDNKKCFILFDNYDDNQLFGRESKNISRMISKIYNELNK